MIQAIILGVIQGLTEFLPISSTAHLVLVPEFLGWEDALLTSLPFDVALHAGTLLSVLICFRRDIMDMLTIERRRLWLLALATVPAGVAGLTLEDYVSGVLRGPGVIGVMLIAFGAVMLVADRVGTRTRGLSSMGVRDALVIGLCQALALVPGVSRSGATISAGLFMGMRRDEAARFSFLLSLPVISGAILLEGRKLFTASAPGGSVDMALVSAGFAASFLTGIVAIRFMLRFLVDHRLDSFVVYRFVLGGFILGWLMFGA
jgi:undecaprenyl-diphosphatase